MKLVVNGKEQEMEDGSTVRQLLATLGLDRDGIAVAVDRRVVPKSAHGETTLSNGCKVEIIRAVGGG
jgi:sulfur carrier protein